MKTLSVKLLQRSDTEKNWESTNPVLGEDELGFVKNSGNFKIGDGSKKWSELPLYESLSPDDRSKLDGIASGANKTTVDSALSSTSTNPVQNKVVNSALAGKSNTNHTHDLSTMINTLTTGTATPNDDDYYVSQYAGGGTTTTTYHRRPLKALFEYIKGKLHKVAVSGSYNDLSNKPTIPSVGNGTITIKQAGAVKGSFTTNQSGATTIELTDNNTNTWRDVVDNLTSTATDKSLSAAQGKWLNENKAAMMTLTNQNLNSVTTPGFYNAPGGNTVSNKPSGVDNFGLIVSHTANGTYYTQILFTTGSAKINKSYRRFCENGAWGNWTEEKLTDTVYTHPSYTAKTNGLYKVTVDSTGHVSGTTAVAKSDITALGIPSTNTTYSTGTASTSGLTKLYTGTGTATDGTMTQAAIKSALDGKSDTGHTHVSLDKIGSVAYIGSDKANTAGWYKVYSTTLTGYSNHVARLLFTYGYSNIGSAILDLHIRCDNATTIYVRELKWESRTGTAFLPGDAIINTNGNTWTLYIYNHQNQYGRMKVRVLESTNTSSNWNMEIKSNETPESATPTATATSSDGGSVNYANSAGAVAWGNVTGKPSTFTPSSHTHDDRYYTESEVDSKLSGKANSSHNHTISQITDIANASVKSATSATTAASAQSVEWNNVKNKPSTYTPSSHSHDNSTITSLDAGKITTGTIDIARLPQGALERCVIVADDTARFKLTKSNVQKGDTVKVTGTGKMYFVIDDTKLSSEDGYTVYTAGSATSAPWSGITGKPATYPPSSHNHDSSYLKLTGGVMTGNISYKGSKFTYEMIKFIDNTSDIYGNGVVIGGGGATIVGGGESADAAKSLLSNGGDEKLFLTNDGNIDFYTNCNNGIAGATHTYIDTNGIYSGKANTAGTADIAKVANSVTWANVSGKPSTFTPASHTHNYAGSSSAGGSAWSSNAVNNIFGSSRQTSGNIDFTNSAYVNKVTYTLATSGMTTGKPPTDGHMLSFGWDTAAGWGAQMSIGDGSSNHLYIRGADSKDNKTTYGDWKTILDSSNYNIYAPTKAGGGASGTWGISITGNAATATKLSSSAGSATRPVYFNDGKPVAGTYTLGDACAKGVTNITTAGTLGWTSSTENAKTVPTLNTIAYWNGAFSNTNSNLAYCNKGAFGTAATKNIGDFATAGHNHDSTYLKLSGGTMTGALNFKNNTWNALGDDVAIGDHDKTGSLGIKGLNGSPKATFVKSDGTNLCNIGSSTAGKLETNATSFQLGGGATITYNSTNKCIDFTFN